MDNYYIWLNNIEEKEELLKLTPREREESFYKDLEFGTGGLRGILGLGTNRMNRYTVRRATQGLAEEIKAHGKAFMEKGVVIAYDSRNKSPEFAAEAAKVLSANQIKAYLFDSLRPTPELSFAVRYLGCARGIVITASHNPKHYNGYKVYGEDGGQLPPAQTHTITKFIRNIDCFKDVQIGENTAQIIGAQVDNAYLDAVFSQRLNVKIPSDFKVIYTPIHGSGNLPVRKILHRIGVRHLSLVQEQELPDGDFPTVKVPNPENKDVFDLAIELAAKENADIIIGTDPDSDRIGVVFKDKNGSYVALNGNQTGILLTEFILQSTMPLPKNPRIVKTIVTTDMVVKIADHYRVAVDNVLTGFKFIGEKIREYENSGKSYLFGLEESYGYLKGTYARDKDAVAAAMLIVQMAAKYKTQGQTLSDALISLYEKYGYYVQDLIAISCEGLDGSDKIDAIMKKLRKTPPEDAIAILDYSTGVCGLPKSDVLKFIYKNGWLAVRPSGTEAKIKIYIELFGNALDKTAKAVEELKGRFIKTYIG